MHRLQIFTIALALIFASCLIYSISASSLSVPDDVPKKRDDTGPDPQLGLDTISFPTSCKPESRGPMNQAIHALHTFWYDEAKRQFNAILDTDRLCVMAYWGLAMSHWKPLQHPLGMTPEDENAGDVAVQRAHTLLVTSQVNITQRENDYLSAASTFFLASSSTTYAQRVALYEAEMKKLYLRYQEVDKEVVPFYALALAASALADPSLLILDNLKAGKMLELLLLDYPYHPGGLNYLVHTYSNELDQATDALPAAVRYQESSPAGAYPLYAPSKIFNYAGWWSHSIVSTTRAVAAAQAADAIAYPDGESSDEYMNALLARTYAVLQQCQDHEVKNVIDQIYDSLKPLSTETAARALALIPARYYFETSRWDQASLFNLEPTRFAWSEHSWSRMFKYFVRTMGWVMLNNMDEMTPNLYELVEAKKEWDSKPEEKAALQPSWRRTLERMYTTAIVWTDWMKTVRESEAGEGEIEADRDKLIDRMHAIAASEGGRDYPDMLLVAVDESVGEMLLMMDRRRAALEEFEHSLTRLPYRFNGFFGATKAACLLYVYGESGKETKKTDEEAKYKCKVYHRLLHNLCHPAHDENHCGERKAYETLNDLMTFVEDEDGDGDGTTTGGVVTSGTTETTGQVTTTTTTGDVTTGTVDTGPSPEEIKAAKVRKLLWLFGIVIAMALVLAGGLFVVQRKMMSSYETIG